MSNISLTSRDGALRIYDGTGTPYYVEVKFEQMDGSFPSGRARAVEEVVPTVAGYVHAPTSGAFDQAYYEPQPLSFSLWVNYQDFIPLRNALSGLDVTDVGQTWRVGAHTWTSVPARGSIVRADSSYISTQPFFDQMKKKVAVETLYTSRHRSNVGSTAGMRFDEVYFPPQSILIQESPDYVEMRVQGLVYGNISTIWNFTTGNSSI